MIQNGSPGGVVSIVREALASFFADLTLAIPKILGGIIFLALAVVLVKTILWLVTRAIRRAFPNESPVYYQFVRTIVAVGLWFGVALSFLSVVGLTGIAASIGTASGFVALGVAYALSDMIEDMVSGVYLLRDPDFQTGDTVTVGDTTGQVASIELRKTRFDVEGDRVIRANAEIEKRWTRREEPATGTD